MTERVEIEFRVDGTDEASDDVERFNRSLGDTKGQVDESSVALSRAGTILGATAAGFATLTAGVAAAAVALRSFLHELERQSAIMGAFGGGVEEARQRLNGFASEMELIVARNELAAAGIQLTEHDFANLAVQAQQTSQALGQDFGTTMGQLREAFVSMSSETLENFGLAVEQSQDKSVVFERVLGRLEDQVGETSASAASAGGALTQLENAVDDAGTAFLETISDSDALQEAFTEFFNVVTGGEGDFEQAMDSMVNAARVMGVAVNMVLSQVADEFRAIGEIWEAVTSGDFSGAIDAARRQFQEGRDFMNNFGDNLTQGVEDAAVRAAMRRGPGATESTIDRPTPRGSGGESAADRQARLNSELGSDVLGSFAEGDVRAEIEQENADAIMEVRAALADWNQDLNERQLENRKEMLREEQQAEEEALTRLQEKRQQAAEEEKEAAQRRVEQIASDAESVLKPAVGGITDALSNIIAGTKSADDAFQGMLSSFLAMIAEQAALEAAKEFAAAIASFASYQYDAGALHLAAGAAWTGVAVAAGAGAIATAPAEAAPVSPDAGASDGGSGSGGATYVYNVNGPVITAGSRANAGREISGVVAEGNRRFGRAA